MNRVTIFLMAVFLAAAQTCSAAGPKKYVPKIVIDTLIQQAFIQLNSASDGMPGSDLRLAQAVAAAKKTASRLRGAATGDPNERYILWKTGELEGQIYLEERDIVLKQLEKRQKESNAAISVFNKELGKKRPDFAVLKKAMDDMSRIDPVKNRELQRSFDQRSDNISKDVMYTLEKAVLGADAGIMQAEFGYCQNNRSWLRLTSAAYNRFETRIRGQSEAIKQAPLIEERLVRIEGELPRNAFSAVWADLTDIQAILSRIDTDLPPKTRELFFSKVKKYSAAANRREDSLTALTYAVCAKSGENAALDYIERVLRPMGISETKLGESSMSILRIAASRKKAGDAAPDADMKDVAGQQGGDDAFTQLRLAAKKKAQRRADSVRAIEEEKALQGRRDRDRADSMSQAVKQQALMALRADQEKASALTVQIYTLIDEKNIEAAYERFLSVQKPLEKYLVRDAFLLLQTTVLQTYMAFLREKSAASGSRAAASGGKSADRGTNADEEKAQEVMGQIYGLLESQNPEAAYRRFCEARAPLEKYAFPEAFVMLETQVLQSYEAVLRKQTVGR